MNHSKKIPSVQPYSERVTDSAWHQNSKAPHSKHSNSSPKHPRGNMPYLENNNYLILHNTSPSPVNPLPDSRLEQRRPSIPTAPKPCPNTYPPPYPMPHPLMISVMNSDCNSDCRGPLIKQAPNTHRLRKVGGFIL
jgi:hypothetical protein